MVNVETDLVESSNFGGGQRSILESLVLSTEPKGGLFTAEPAIPNYVKVAKSNLEQVRIRLTHEDQTVINWMEDAIHKPVTILLHFRRCLF